LFDAVHLRSRIKRKNLCAKAATGRNAKTFLSGLLRMSTMQR
jgi:hypothetical protein